MTLDLLGMCYCNQMAYYFPSVHSWTWCWFPSREPWMAISPSKAKSPLLLTNYKNLVSSQYILTWLTMTVHFVCSSGTFPISGWVRWGAQSPHRAHTANSMESRMAVRFVFKSCNTSCMNFEAIEWGASWLQSIKQAGFDHSNNDCSLQSAGLHVHGDIFLFLQNASLCTLWFSSCLKVLSIESI